MALLRLGLLRHQLQNTTMPSTIHFKQATEEGERLETPSRASLEAGRNVGLRDEVSKLKLSKFPFLVRF